MPFPAVVDNVDGRVEAKYAAWPSRLFVIGNDGRVAYRTRLSELDFHPADVESAIQRVLAAPASQRSFGEGLPSELGRRW